MKRFGDRLISLLIWTTALPVFSLVCLKIILASYILPSRALEPLIKFSCRLVLFVCGIRVRLHGREYFDPSRQYVVMMNHVNFFDPLVLYYAFPGWARGVEEESHFRWPVYGPTIRRLGVIPISRSDSFRAKESMKRAAALVRSRGGFSMIVFPEGRRTKDGNLVPFKKGGFLLAAETGLGILPVVQVGARRVSRKGSLLIRPGTIDVFIEAPLSPEGYEKENIKDYIERVRSVFLRRVPG